MSIKASLGKFIDRSITDHLPTHAAALAFYSVLTLAPIISSMLFISSFLPFSFFDPLISSIRQLGGPQAATAVQEVVEQIKTPNLRSLTGLFSVATVLFLGSALFSQLRGSLNVIFRAPLLPPIKWLIKRLAAIGVLFFLILALALVAVTLSVLRILEAHTQILISPLFDFFELILLILSGASIYRLIPDVRLPWGACFVGGALGTAFFVIGSTLFRAYIEVFAIGSVYGAASAMFVFLVWIYYSAFILFAGAEVTWFVRDNPSALFRRATTWLKGFWGRRRRGRLLIFLFALLALILILRAVTPEVVRHYLNRELSSNGDWSGYISDVDLKVIRGAVVLEGVKLDREPQKEISFASKVVQVNLSWIGLLKKELRFDLILEEPLLEILIKDLSSKPGSKKEEIKDAQEKAGATGWPILLGSLQILSGALRVRDLSSNALPTFRVYNINLNASNIWNQIEEQKGPSQIEFSGTTSGRGRLSGKLLLSAFSPSPNFKGELKIESLDLRVLSSFLKNKINVVVQEGSLDLFLEFATRGWQLEGYIKPIISDLKFSDTEGGNKKNPSFWQKLWAGILNWVTAMFTNQETNELAGKIRFSGDLSDPKTSPLSAALSLVRNAFIEAILGGFDRDLKIKPKFPHAKK